MSKILVVCTTDSMIWNFLIPHIKHLESLGNHVDCACSETGFYFNELVNKHGINCFNIPFKRSPFKFSNIKCYRLLKDLIKSNDYDWIYCHEPVGGALGRLAGKANKKKTVYIAHGFHFFKGASLKHWLLYRGFEWFLSFYTDVIITINHEDYNNSLKLHAKSKYLIPGIGVDFTSFDITTSEEQKTEFRKLYGVGPSDILMVSVGELSVRKNHQVILKSMKQLNNSHLHLLICGEGSLEEKLKKMAARYGLADKIHFAGFRRDINKILRYCDLFVFPSLWEGLGLAGIEAMYSGVPIIASNRQGIKDYVIDGCTGFVFEPRSYKELSKCVLKVCSLSHFEIDTIVTSGKHEISKYSIQNSIESIDSILIKEGL